VLYPKSWWKSVAFLPMLMAAGVALTISNSKAVIEALLGIKSSFARTAKYGSGKMKAANAVYRRRSGWLPFLELAAGTYFVYMIDFAIDTYNFLAIPFLLLFVCGYYWAAFSTLYQEYRGRLQWQRARKLAQVQ
jgi:hypothetical protein